MSKTVPARRTSLSGLLEEGGLFIDGDWVESKDQDPNGDVRLIQLADIGDGTYIDKSARFLTSAKARELKCTFLSSGDILVARMPDPLGRACMFPGDTRPCVTVVDVCIVRPDKGTERRWLLHAINSPGFRNQIQRHIKGTTRQRISRTNLGTVELIVPPLAEQRRIADILDKADAIRRKRKEAIALTEELLRSTFLEMFGDPVTNPKGWPTETIGDLCQRNASLVDGPFGSSLKPEHYVNDGIPVVRNWNIHDDRFDNSAFKYVTEEKFKELRRSEVVPNDVLITTKGTVGDVCLAPNLGAPAVLSASGTARLRLPPDGSYAPSFVVSQMITPTFKQYLHRFEAGSAQKYLNLSAIKKMKLIRPPSSLQHAFTSSKHSIRSLMHVTTQGKHVADILMHSLIKSAFSGESNTDRG